MFCWLQCWSFPHGSSFSVWAQFIRMFLEIVFACASYLQSEFLWVCQLWPPVQKSGVLLCSTPSSDGPSPSDPVWSCLLQPERGVSLWAASSVRCHCCWCRCVCYSSGCRWCVKAPRNTVTCPPGDRQNKSPGVTHQCRSFPLKRRSEVAYLSCMWLDSRDAGRAAQPGPFTSVLKERGGKENLRPGLFCALDKIKPERNTEA